MKKVKGILFIVVMCILGMSREIVKAEEADFSQATKIDLGVKTAGEILVEKEKDFYVFTTTENNSYYEINFINTNIQNLSVGAYVNVWNEEHTNVLLTLDVSAHSAGTESIKLNPRTNYYIEVYSRKISSYGTGDYKITVTEVQDDGMDTMDSATKVSANKNYSNAIEEVVDKDWYYFETGSNDAYSVKLINKNAERPIKFEIYDEDGVRLNTFFVDKNTSVINTYKLNKNAKYYIAFSAENSVGWKSTGDYTYIISTTLKLNKSSISIKKSETVTLKATFAGDKDSISSIKWTSANKNIVTVTSKGVIKGVSKGKAKVTCKYELKDGTTITRICTVTVN